MKRISMIEVVAKETIDELIQIVDIENMLTVLIEKDSYMSKENRS